MFIEFIGPAEAESAYRLKSFVRKRLFVQTLRFCLPSLPILSELAKYCRESFEGGVSQNTVARGRRCVPSRRLRLLGGSRYFEALDALRAFEGRLETII